MKYKVHKALDGGKYANLFKIMTIMILKFRVLVIMVTSERMLIIITLQ